MRECQRLEIHQLVGTLLNRNPFIGAPNVLDNGKVAARA